MSTLSFQDTIINTILPQITTRIERNTQQYGNQFPSYGDGNRKYNLTANENWLASFWSGLLWLLCTQDDRVCETALKLLPSFEERLDKKIRLNHDLGFIFTLSARAAYQLTGDDAARQLALRAAEVLYQRYNPAGQYIQAWGEIDDPAQAGRFIIDCMMNLPLLFWAHAETGEQKYYDAAINHARTSQQYLLREDGSTYHTYYLKPETGEAIGAKTHQGYADDSLWSRGQAWAVYGFPMVAEWTGESEFIDTAKKAAGRYLADAPLTDVVPWDLRLPDDAPAYPDSSADAITAGGLLRLADLTGDTSYRHHAESLLHMLYKQAFDTRENAQGLLLHGTQHAPHGYGIDTYTIFGDYFFLEALLKLAGNTVDFWSPDNKKDTK